MTEKRFKLKDYGYDGWAVEDTTGEIFENDYLEDMSDKQVVDTLNDLHEENRKLKIEIETYKKGNATIHNMLKCHIDFLKSEGYGLKDVIRFMESDEDE